MTAPEWQNIKTTGSGSVSSSGTCSGSAGSDTAVAAVLAMLWQAWRGATQRVIG